MISSSSINEDNLKCQSQINNINININFHNNDITDKNKIIEEKNNNIKQNNEAECER